MRLSLFFCLGISTLRVLSQSLNADQIYRLVTDSLDDPIDRVEALHSYASSVIKTDATLAEELSNQMLKLSTDEAYILGKAHAHYNIGVTCMFGPYPKAIQNLIRAFDLYVEAGSVEGQANSLLSLANVYDGMGQVEESKDVARKALKMAAEINNRQIQSRAHTNLTAIYHHVDKIDSALYHGKIALALKRELKDEYGTRLMLLNMGVIMANYDSLLDEGLRYLQEVRSITTDPIMINDIIANLIYAYARKGDYNTAEIYLDSAVVGADSTNNFYPLQGIHRTSKEMYSRMGDYPSAFYHLNQEFELDKKLRGSEVQEKYEILQLEYENEKNQHQILQLEKEKAETYFKYTIAIIVVISTIIVGMLIYLIMRYRIRNARLKEEELQLQLDHKNKELASYAINFVQKNELIGDIKVQISELRKKATPETGKQLRQINRIIDDNYRVDKEWENFKLRFEEVHGDFFKALTEKYPDLGNAEVKLCALLRLNMNLKESSQILGISSDSVKTARYRIRKKMGLSTDDNLVKFISTIGD